MSNHVKPAVAVTRSIPLRRHEAICAALELASFVGSDEKAVVMVKGYNDDWHNFTAIYLDDYEPEELADPSCFSDYGSIQMWVSLTQGGAK